MPFSWVLIPSNTSRKIRARAGDDRTKVRFKELVEEIAENAGGSAREIYFELSGKFAHAHIYWDEPEQKQRIVFDLEAEEVVDLYSAGEIDAFDAAPYSAG